VAAPGGAQRRQHDGALGWIAAVGATVPASVALHALPATVTRQIPEMRPYAYARLGKMLLIINPTDRVIVDVITD
jgi:uncharacterized membrane protein